ncbi:MAG: cystathionine beta-lyase [Rhodospirillales bacterium]|nr:cystathionine beta-lyase [Rhodospirillales bacterium]
MKKETLLLHAGRDPKKNYGIVNPPVYHCSTVTFPTLAALEASQASPLGVVHYGRYGTPTTYAFEQGVAALEGAPKCVSAPSGLAAISIAMLAMLKAGDHALITDNAYFPLRKLCNDMLGGFGIEVTFYDPMVGAGIKDLIRPKTKVVWVESPGSQTFEVQDIPAIAKAAHAAGAVVIMDNTWSAGYYFDAFEHGVDISVQAATKYIVGHSDAMLGTVTTTEALWEKVKWTAVRLGYCAGPDDCYLGLRGLRTLATRLARHQETALFLARWLATRPEVERVLHPALASCPGHDIWKRDFTGSSGLFGVVLKEFPKAAVAAMLDGMEHFAMGYSWGGFESLIVPTYPPKVRSATRWPHAGPSIRIHAGLEDPEDLKQDIAAGLKRLVAAA